jgi:SNF2 family DNA or RNA helicase
LRAQVMPEIPEPLPPDRRYVTLSNKERKLYNEMASNLVTYVEHGEIVGWNPLTQVTRLLQLASAHADIVQDADGLMEKVVLEEPSSKLDALEDYLLDIGDKESVVVAAVSRQLIQLAEVRLAHHNIETVSVHGAISTEQRALNIDAFQEGRARVMLLTVGAGGEGITLTRAANICFLQRAWSLVQNMQTEDRVIRFGQDRQVQVTDLVTENTVEESVLERIVEKGDRLEQVVRDRNRLLELLK